MADTKIWVEFFTTAGIISNVIPNYVDIFIENRIRLDMLPDLKKQYLKEMGIHALGDVIAILRHARQFYNKHASSNAVNNNKQTSETKSSPRPIDNGSQGKVVRTTSETKASSISGATSMNTDYLKPLPVASSGPSTYNKAHNPSGTIKQSGDGDVRTSRIVRLEKAPAVPYERRSWSKKQPRVSPPTFKSNSDDLLADGVNVIKSKPKIKQKVLLVSGTQNNPSSTTSIFARLGNYSKSSTTTTTTTTTEIDLTSLKSKPLTFSDKFSTQSLSRRATPPKRLSTPPRKSLTTKKSQKVFLVSKVPTKTGSDDDEEKLNDFGMRISDSDDEMLGRTDLRRSITSNRSVTVTSVKKNVKFARESEICESILTSPKSKATASTVKSRLGIKNKDLPPIKHTVSFKHETRAISGALKKTPAAIGNRLGLVKNVLPKPQTVAAKTSPIKDLRQILEKKSSNRRLH